MIDEVWQSLEREDGKTGYRLSKRSQSRSSGGKGPHTHGEIQQRQPAGEQGANECQTCWLLQTDSQGRPAIKTRFLTIPSSLFSLSLFLFSPHGCTSATHDDPGTTTTAVFCANVKHKHTRHAAGFENNVCRPLVHTNTHEHNTCRRGRMQGQSVWIRGTVYQSSRRLRVLLSIRIPGQSITTGRMRGRGRVQPSTGRQATVRC